MPREWCGNPEENGRANLCRECRSRCQRAGVLRGRHCSSTAGLSEEHYLRAVRSGSDGDSSHAWWEGCPEGLLAGKPSGGLEVTEARTSSHEMDKTVVSLLKDLMITSQ